MIEHITIRTHKQIYGLSGGRGRLGPPGSLPGFTPPDQVLYSPFAGIHEDL